MQEGNRRTRVATWFAAGFFSFAVLIGICLITFSIVFFFSEVHGPSMQMSLNASGQNTDSVLANRVARNNPRQGDIIIVRHYYRYDRGFKEYHIKRLIAVGPAQIHFYRYDTDGRPNANTTGRFFEIQVNGIAVEHQWSQYLNNYINFATGTRHNLATIPRFRDFMAWQNGGAAPSPLGYPSPTFRTQTRDGSHQFRQTVTRNGITRNEIVLPAGYIFYVGDHRGGPEHMSVDSTTFGPQPANRVVGVVAEVINDMSALEWLWDRFVWIITFRWIR